MHRKLSVTSSSNKICITGTPGIRKSVYSLHFHVFKIFSLRRADFVDESLFYLLRGLVASMLLSVASLDFKFRRKTRNLTEFVAANTGQSIYVLMDVGTSAYSSQCQEKLKTKSSIFLAYSTNSC